MTEEALREIYRTRWRREREAVCLLDPSRADFGMGGLGRRVPKLTVRLFVLPGDPETELIEFEQPFWAWLKGDHANPFAGPPTDWGARILPTTAAAVRCVPISNDWRSWDSYLAISRCGGLDMGLGLDGAHEENERRVFWLVHIVGRVWTTLQLYRDAIGRFGIKGPWECSVALLKTVGGAIGNFGVGWAQYGHPLANVRPCSEANLLWRRELDVWPDDTQQVAFRIGAWIEESWDSQLRRFLAHEGPLAGQFDVSQYR